MTYAQGERLSTFLDLERLGQAVAYYPPSVYAARRREARKLGYSANDPETEPLEIGLTGLMAQYFDSVESAAA